ncbi:plakophilin-3a isoform 1-T1 [Menidia menidia]
MSAISTENVFFTALQPNSSVTTYGLPSEMQLGNGGSASDMEAKARRVQQQVQMRLAEKSTLPRQNGTASQFAMSDYDGSSTVKYNTYTPNFSSKSSFMYSGSRTMGPQMSQRNNFSSRSAGPQLAQFQKMSIGGGFVGGGDGGFHQDDFFVGGHRGTMRQQSRMDHDAMSFHSIRNPPIDNSDNGSMMSERDAVLSHQYAQSAVNGYATQRGQGGGTMTYQAPMRRSLSSTLIHSGGMMGGGGAEVIQQQHSFKGPAYRTINRIANRNRMSMGSTSGNIMSASASSFGGGRDRVDQGFIMPVMPSGSQGNLLMQRQGNLSRAASLKSIHSVGKGYDVTGMNGGEFDINGLNDMDMATAVDFLRQDDTGLQVLGAAYIQHQCYNHIESKDQVRLMEGIEPLVKLISSKNREVQGYVTGATRNLIYGNNDNKKALVQLGGIPALVKALEDEDEELQKNITGILWNLSSRETMKDLLAKETLYDLTKKILVPLVAKDLHVNEDLSLEEIIYNTTGCLRNLSSGNDKTRTLMKDTDGLVESLVKYFNKSVEKDVIENKGVENAMCILRNLSYKVLEELPPSVKARLGENRDLDTEDMGTVGCFTPQSRKAKKKKTQLTFSEISKSPKDQEWLYHPKILGVYHTVMKSRLANTTCREAAIGAMQNITSGDMNWASELSNWALEQERVLPTILDCLYTDVENELRSLTCLLRNLSRHTNNKDDMATKTINSLLEKLPRNSPNDTSNEVILNICGVLNNLVTGSFVAARDINFFNGVEKLMCIKNTKDTSPGGLRAAKAASTVLTNMYHYKKLRKKYATKGFTRKDFTVDY